MIRAFKKRQLSDSDIPVASFSDLAFLLIIFFILTTTFQKQMGFVTDMPAGEKGQAQEQKTTTIALHDGQISLNDQAVTLRDLRRRLLDLRLSEKRGEERMVLLSAAGRVDYQTYFETMAQITAAGGVIAIVREEDKKAREAARP